LLVLLIEIKDDYEQDKTHPIYPITGKILLLITAEVDKRRYFAVNIDLSLIFILIGNIISINIKKYI